MHRLQSIKTKALDDIQRVSLHINGDSVTVGRSGNMHTKAPRKITFIGHLKLLLQLGNNLKLKSKSSGTQQHVIHIHRK